MKDVTATIHPGSSIVRGRKSGSRVLHFILSLHSRILCAAAVMALGNLTVEAQATREYQLKAVFLFNFAQFTDWPDSAFANAKSPLVIGVVGADPFGSALKATIHDESIKGRPIVLEHYSHVADIKPCHMLFITQPELRHIDEIVNSVKDKPVLTVADNGGAASAAAIIRFTLQNNKVHFRINVEAAQAAKLSLSSKLLRVADATPPGGTVP